MSWGIYCDGKDNHVVPEDETALHTLSQSCSCGPRPDHSDFISVWVHRSRDFRELIEEAEAIKKLASIS